MLEDELKKLAAGGVYPLHMPGHKRNAFADFPNPYTIDITEIEGFDNLHNPRGVLKEEQERAAALYGSGRCFYLVNGSTCGILAAICAAARPGDTVLVARNCHRAVYNALYLRQLRPLYVYPADTGRGIWGQIAAGDVRQKLAEHTDIRAVILTSPTYEGIVSDVAEIAALAHERGIPLIVDEAHGAHFGFHEAFPENATRLGADAVIMSVHKTLPAFTQTALLHLCGNRLAEAEVARFLGIFETSSPSYVLMAGISRCVGMLAAPSVRGRFEAYAQRLEEFRARVHGLSHFLVPGAGDFAPEEAYAFDPGKLIIETGDSGMSGARLKEVLLERYHLQTEMAGADYVLAMTSLMDTREGFARLAAALEELDAEAGARLDEPAGRGRGGSRAGGAKIAGRLYGEKERCMDIGAALDAERELVPLADAPGRICADFVCLYPPGIPVFVPGERIGAAALDALAECASLGLEVDGFVCEDTIQVVK